MCNGSTKLLVSIATQAQPLAKSVGLFVAARRVRISFLNSPVSSAVVMRVGIECKVQETGRSGIRRATFLRVTRSVSERSSGRRLLDAVTQA